MSAAVVISLRIKRTIRLLKERGAVSPETALSKQEIPYANHWYIRRLVAKGVIKEIGDRWYINPAEADEYLAGRRNKAILILTALLILTLLYCIFFVQ